MRRQELGVGGRSLAEREEEYDREDTGEPKASTWLGKVDEEGSSSGVPLVDEVSVGVGVDAG